MDQQQDLADWYGTSNTATRTLLEMAGRPGVISLAGGLPAPEIFPVEAVADAYAHVIRQNPVESLQYGATAGSDRLRDLIARRLSTPETPIHPDNVLITTGSLQGLGMVGQALINAGDPIAIDEPTFMGALDAWRPTRPRIIPIDWSGNRPRFGKSATAVNSGENTAPKPKFAYCLPNFRNPTGESLDLAHREALVAAAKESGVYLLEDNPYGELQYDGERQKSLLSLSGNPDADPSQPYDGQTIYLGTVSKTLAPALRVGFMVAPARLVDAMTVAKQGMDLCTSPVNQLAAAYLIETGVEAETTERACTLYGRRRDIMLDELARQMPAEITWTKPEGGMFIWVTLPPGLSARALTWAAAETGVAIVPGEVFYAMEPSDSHLRLNFTNTPEDRIPEGIARLARVIDGMRASAA